jgi:hypothetical protein
VLLNSFPGQILRDSLNKDKAALVRTRAHPPRSLRDAAGDNAETHHADSLLAWSSLQGTMSWLRSRTPCITRRAVAPSPARMPRIAAGHRAL